MAMKVLGTVITSSPGPTPDASSASQSASVPLPTPIACSQLQYAAKSSSNPLDKRSAGERPAVDHLLDRRVESRRVSGA